MNPELNPNIGSDTKPESGYRWVAVALVSMAILLNYLDRVNISVAMPTLMKELHLSASQLGVLSSAFFWSYTLMMVPAGAFLNKYGPKWAMFTALFGWGGVTMLTGAVTTFWNFMAVRIALGLTEAPGFPASARVVSVWTPLRERTFATSCFDSAARVGSAFAPPLVAYIILSWGWRMSFVITGALALLYSFVWIALYKEPDEHPKVTKSELAYIRQNEVVDSSGKVVSKPIGMFKLFTYRRVLQVCVAYGMYLYVWTVFSTWMPTYLVKVRHLDTKTMGWYAMIPYLVAVICELFGGQFFDNWYRRGASNSTLRRTGMGIGLIGTALFIYLTMGASSPQMAIFWISCFMGIFAFGASNVWAIPGDIAPYGQAGGVGGAYNFIGNFGSLLAPMVTGFFIDSHYGFNGAFAVCVVISVIAGLLFIFNSYERLEPKASDL